MTNKMVNWESPYANTSPEEWQNITKKLVDNHPLSSDEIVVVVLESWDDIFKSKIGGKPLYFGRDLFPKPQIMGFLLHELVSEKAKALYPGQWEKEMSARDKDMIYLPNDTYSVEIKTSSSPTSIFGNRSYAQKKRSSSKKTKSGYYLAINFEKFKEGVSKPRILKIRFGWLDHDDWIGQKAATGQQARLSKVVEDSKLIELYSVK